jgi:hypothetical protein
MNGPALSDGGRAVLALNGAPGLRPRESRSPALQPRWHRSGGGLPRETGHMVCIGVIGDYEPTNETHGLRPRR